MQVHKSQPNFFLADPLFILSQSSILIRASESFLARLYLEGDLCLKQKD